ncbi:MAG: metallophosphoesterase [Candidatus Anstonellaceae archaeon]
MKIAFVSDTHFGYERFEEDALRQGREAIISASKLADIIILGGDIFDKRNPNLDTIVEVVEILKEAKQNLREEYGKKILAIAGTHEYGPKTHLDPIEFLEKLGLVENIHDKVVVFEKEEQKVAIVGLKGIPENLVKKAFEKFEQKVVKGAYNIFVFHQTLQEFIGVGDEVFASIEDLPAGYDLYLCGHIHCRRSYLNGKLQLSGSTVITQLKDEEQEPKGYLLIDTKTKEVEFIKIPTRKFIVKEIELYDATTNQIKSAIEKELEKIESQKYENPIVKIRLKGTLNKQALFPQIEIKRENMIVEIDNQLEGLSLFEKISNLKNKNEENIETIGLKFLIENAAKINISREKAEDLFKKFLEEKN